MQRLTFYIVCLLTLYACTSENNKNITISNKSNCLNSNYNIKLNNQVRILAALPVESNSEYYQITQTKIWKQYKKDVDEGWKKFSDIAQKYIQFRENEIKGKYADSVTTLFYPFGGPDFLFANLFFPDVNNIILIGLERPGKISTIPSEPEKLSQVLNLFKVAVEDVMQLSFFRTLDMNEQLSNELIDGTTPIILFFIARAGYYINQIKYFKLDSLGYRVAISSNDYNQADGVEISYFNNSDTLVRKVFYLSTNLANQALQKKPQFIQFFNKIDKPYVTMVKSATYLMHKDYFSIIRNICLTHSSLIVQDDSGIAFRFFEKDLWDIQLYGKYTKPIKLFENFYQSDMAFAYKKKKIKALDFRIGYSKPSNLLIAQKKL